MGLTRRRFIVGAGLVGSGAAAGGLATFRQEPARSAPPGPMRFATRPDLQIPALRMERTGTTAEGMLFLSPHRGTGQSDALILDEAGRPVWFHRSNQLLTDFRAQTYQGAPVLTYWEGRRREGGYGDGVGVILDRSYRRIATVRAVDGVHSDLHEFQLTDRGTALLIAYPKVKADLRALGGPKNGQLLDNRIQEIDISTGRALFDWSALDHLGLKETFVEIPEKGVIDPFHLNSVEDDGEALLVSARNTHAVYSIDRRTGKIRWRLGGRRNDFEMDRASTFAWQHDARRREDGTISLFDNHIATPGEGASRGIILDVDEERRRVSLVSAYSSGPKFGQYMGNLQNLANGNVLIGWGSTAGATEFTADGTIVMEVEPGQSASYRAYRLPWDGAPTTRPDVTAKRRPGSRLEVHASWNGATRVRAWRFLAGSSQSRLTQMVTVPRDGFETKAVIRPASHVAVEALAGDQRVLARSVVRTVA